MLLKVITHVALAAFAFTAVLGTPAAYAANPNAAIVLKDLDHPSGCFVSVPISSVPLFTSDEIHTTATPSGNVSLICHFNIPAGSEPARAVKASGFTCGIFLPGPVTAFTNNTELVANPGGRAVLKCQIKANQL